MNQVNLIGNLTRDVELRRTSSDKSVAQFSIAVKRDFSKDEKVDFFKVTAWNNAENIAKYLSKGSKCLVTGRIQNSQYTDKEGVTKYTTDIIAERVEFLSKVEKSQPSDDDFPLTDEDVPF